MCSRVCGGLWGAHECVCAYRYGGQRTTWGIFLRSYPTLLLRCGLSGTWFFTTRLHCLAKETQDLPSCLLFPKTKNANMCLYIRLLCCCFLFFIHVPWGSNSSPHACILSHLSFCRSSFLLFVSYLGPEAPSQLSYHVSSTSTLFKSWPSFLLLEQHPYPSYIHIYRN